MSQDRLGAWAMHSLSCRIIGRLLGAMASIAPSSSVQVRTVSDCLLDSHVGTAVA